MPGDQQRCMDAGMNGYLAKPIRVAELRQACVRFLRPARDGAA